jgi:hypothetical protein
VRERLFNLPSRLSNPILNTVWRVSPALAAHLDPYMVEPSYDDFRRLVLSHGRSPWRRFDSADPAEGL